MSTLAAVAAVGLVAAGCASSSPAPSASSQVPLSAKQTIVFSTQGLGLEGTATTAAVNAFEKANPNITVKIQTLSSSSNVALEQQQQAFMAGSSTPDVLNVDVIRPAEYAKPHWILNLNKFHPNTANFFAGQMASGQYKGGTYAIPWFMNAEGLFYRTDLIKTPPTTISQLVADAKAAMAAHPSLKMGLAFEGAKYEGGVTAFQSMGGQFTASNLSNINTSANKSVLQFEYNAINKYKITPSAASTWEEPNVQSAWLAGQTPFALNWPYLAQLSEKSGSVVAGKTGWVPFPNVSGGPAQASLGGSDLVINAKSVHQAAAWKFISYLTSNRAQIARAVLSGDPPSVKSAYNSTLFAKAPYFKMEPAVYNAAVSRPVTPVYANISSEMQ
ncbi:MAG: extracellular solute-binding protein, partial [Acidimicrobiales bacterium]